MMSLRPKPAISPKIRVSTASKLPASARLDLQSTVKAQSRTKVDNFVPNGKPLMLRPPGIIMFMLMLEFASKFWLKLLLFWLS